MNDHGYTISFSVQRTPDEVYDAINNVRGWWSGAVEGATDQVGAEFTYRVPDIHYSKIRVIELVPSEKVVWRVLDNHLSFVDDQSEWIDTEIRFELTEMDGQTEVRFTHIGLVPEFECFDACSSGWSFYIEGSLRNLIITGEGTPNSNPDEARYREHTDA